VVEVPALVADPVWDVASEEASHAAARPMDFHLYHLQEQLLLVRIPLTRPLHLPGPKWRQK
jgi:hypothetical protein